MRRVHEVPTIRRLKRDAHKGDRGRVLIVAGSRTMSGAARLAGWGALRGGGGLVTVATPEGVQPIVAQELSCALTLPLPSGKGSLVKRAAPVALEAAQSADVVVVGPGLGTSCAAFLRTFLKEVRRPLVLDADALNLIAREPDMLRAKPATRILTPHPGEASRLLGRDVESDARSRAAAAEELADRFRAVVVLKGVGTVVCDGDRIYVNRTGNPGMATGGSGDVLAGLLGARLAVEERPLVAAIQAVHAHGRAGDLAAAGMGELGMTAQDLVPHVPQALAELHPPASKPKAHRPDKASGSGKARRTGGGRSRRG